MNCSYQTKYLNLFILMLFFFSVGNAQPSYQRSVTFGDTTYLFGSKYGRLELTPDNDIIIMETRRQTNVKEEYVIHKFDSALNPVFTTRLRRPFVINAQGDFGGDVLPLQDGGLLFTSQVDGPTSTSPDDIALFRFNNQGSLIYHRQYHNSSSLFPFNLKYFGPDSILLGFRAGSRFGYMMSDENGDLKHTRTGYFSGIVAYGNSGLIRTNDHHILNFAEAYGDSSPADKPQLALAKYDQNGNVQWAYRYEDTLYHYFIYDGIELANGNFFFCGNRRETTSSGGQGFITCISPSGQLLWSKIYNPTSFTLNKLTLLAPDTILVSGIRKNPYYGVNLLVDSTGSLIYSSGYNIVFQSSSNYHMTVCNSEKQFISVTGLSPWGGDCLILSKSYPSNYNHCAPLSLSPAVASITGFTVYSDFIPSNTALIDVPTTRTYTYDTTLPLVSLLCTSTGIGEFSSEGKSFLNISPNPCNGNFKVNYNPLQNEVGQMEISDIHGRKVYEMNLPIWSSTQLVSLPESFNSGIYSCTIKSGNEKAFGKLIVMGK